MTTKERLLLASWHLPKREQLERRAAEMRQYNLTHGTGCKSIARAIEARERREK